MSDWQSWVVALVLLYCVYRIGRGIYTFSRRVKEKRNPCEHCAGCCKSSKNAKQHSSKDAH